MIEMIITMNIMISKLSFPPYVSFFITDDDDDNEDEDEDDEDQDKYIADKDMIDD